MQFQVSKPDSLKIRDRWQDLGFRALQFQVRNPIPLKIPGIVARSRFQSLAVSDSKPDSTEDPPCMWLWCTPNVTSWVKRPPLGVARKCG
ncbi:hypothetical protein AVEN_162825-1 [Araneus ventricosus]|uniref:Uncharacterized protein n=1 Tax=Araneus ventricosus TaxID=182803 RepID=A0A4Y2C602_ARAVE|nr:hypothetical protein AVEN_162825-1 [Araneus ventricosus]